MKFCPFEVEIIVSMICIDTVVERCFQSAPSLIN